MTGSQTVRVYGARWPTGRFPCPTRAKNKQTNFTPKTELKLTCRKWLRRQPLCVIEPWIRTHQFQTRHERFPSRGLHPPWRPNPKISLVAGAGKKITRSCTRYSQVSSFAKEYSLVYSYTHDICCAITTTWHKSYEQSTYEADPKTPFRCVDRHVDIPVCRHRPFAFICYVNKPAALASGRRQRKGVLGSASYVNHILEVASRT